MNDKFYNLFIDVSNKFVDYLPKLFAGIILMGIGWFFAWFVKRTIIRLSVILKLDRFLIRFRWGKGLSNADVRYGFYNFLGNIAFFIVLLVFINFALITWELNVLSDLLGKAILFFPRFATSLAILGIGGLVVSWATRALLRALLRENIPHATLITLYAKTLLIILFSAMAIIEMNIAREIVIIGFATIFITLGVVMVVLTVVGGREFVKKREEYPGEK